MIKIWLDGDFEIGKEMDKKIKEYEPICTNY